MVSPHTVLFVEDEPHLREGVSFVLRQEGYVVLEAGTGAAALEHAAQHPEIDGVITDIRLPDMYGRRLAERIAEQRAPHLPPLGVLFVSGNATEAAHDAPLQPLEAFLAKPFDFEDLLARLEEILDRAAAARPD